MMKNFGMIGVSIASALVILVFGSLLLHYESRIDALDPPAWKSAHAPEVLKDSGAILVAMRELATDSAVHPLKPGSKGERAVFQRNPYYQPATIARSWETTLKDIRLSPYALSSKEAFVTAVSRGIPGTDHPGISGLTSAEWDSAYQAAKASAH
jgi:hypothetical protein